MKRLIVAAMIAAMALSVSGCGQQNTAATPQADKEAASAASDSEEPAAPSEEEPAAESKDTGEEASAGQESGEEQGIGLVGVGNARELGGYKTADGKTVKKGIFLRTAALGEATEEDITRLKEEYHLATVVDFRMDMERDASPDPEIEGVKNVHIRIMDEEKLAEKQKNIDPAKLEGLDLTNRMDQLKLAVMTGVVGPDMYKDFLSNEQGKKGYKQFFEEILSLPEDGSILFHCSQGKDRTGCGAMLILSALGVDEETIMEDFLLTNTFNAQKIEGERKMLEEHGIEGEELDTMLKAMDEVDPEYMNIALTWMKEEYGSVQGYLTDGLGITEEQIGQLKDRYLE
ncbi:MAG: tyrosine-protein phosphatase [Lachnospiraceae bacterium]|nr:tyrosine-protein phosphatase [Lachnospiraceae bacterium]